MDSRLPRRGFFLLCLTGFSVALNLWLERSTLLPIARRTGVEYVFVSATFRSFAELALAACGVILAGHLLIRHRAAQRAGQPPLFAAADVSYLSPLLCLAASALGLLNLVPRLGGVLPVWSYVIVDLHWWWTTLVLTWVLSNIDRRLHGALGEWAMSIHVPPFVRRSVPTVALVGIAVAWVVLGTPHLRFSGDTIGDERRYLRYCELWYQGLGFEISHIRPIADLPSDFRPRVGHNFALLAQELPGELRSLARDAAAFVADPSRRFNQASGTGRFFKGKGGRAYQVHQPGVSFLMFPAYYLDRRFGKVTPGSGSQWPAELPAVNAFFLALYALWTVLIFRFLRRSIETEWVPWITTLAIVLTMPLAAFPFQIYPELAAGVVLFTVAGHLLFSDRGGLGTSFFFGALAGFLPWLHVRFSVLAAVLALAGVVLLRRNKRRLVGFLAGFVVPLACFSLYAYRLTGSVLPTAMWRQDGTATVFSWFGMSRVSVAYLLDREWGLFAYAPLYLFALPGYWWLARRRPDIAWLSALGLLALLLPAAGHSLGAGGTTPMRLIVAVLPLAAPALAEVIARCGRSRLFQASFAMLLVVSLDNALAYNLNHHKFLTRFVDRSFSGWKVNLLFPVDAERWEFSSPNGGLLAAWIVTLVALVLAPALIQRARALPHVLRVPSIGPVALMLTMTAVLLATGASAATGAWTQPRFQIPAEAAEQAVARRVRQTGQCTICISSTRGRLDPDALKILPRRPT